MDAENNFDSDTSESWSLIDVNDDQVAENEITEGIDAAAIITETSSSNFRHSEKFLTKPYTKLPAGSVLNVNSVNTLNGSLNVESSSSSLSSPSDHSKDEKDFQILYKSKGFENNNDIEKKLKYSQSKISFSEDEIVNVEIKDLDNDTDGISVISESECSEFQCLPYGNYEICKKETSESNLTENINPSVLRRKRKKLKLSFRESSEESVSSDFMVPDRNYYPDIQNIGLKASDNEMQVKEYQNAPVYRHYRNNVANTVLSMAMGVIFTGVACIAIGHFLGVHDAQQTAGEMMQTLKRLQMENVLLHTRLAQLSRAFFSRGSNKLELRHKIEPDYLEKYNDNLQNVCDSNKNNLNQDGIKNSMFFDGKSIDISTSFNEPAESLTYKCFQIGNEMNVLAESHDQSKFFNISKYQEVYLKIPYSTTIPVKTGTVYRKFMSSNIGDAKKKSKQSGRKVKEKDVRLFVDKDCPLKLPKFDTDNDNAARRNCLAVREKDLSRFRWFLLKKKKRKNCMVKNDGLGDNEQLYKFPQPEEYYNELNEERDDSNRVIKVPKVLMWEYDGLTSNGPQSNYLRNSTNYIDESEIEVTRRKKSSKIKKKVKRDKNYPRDEGKDTPKKKKKLQKKESSKSARITKDYSRKYPKDDKKRKNDSRKTTSKSKEWNRKGDGKRDTKSGREDETKKYSNEKPKKNSKIHSKNGRDLDKNLFEQLRKKRSNFRSKKLSAYSITHHFKSTNETECEECAKTRNSWFYKWAKGRERCRRDQKISDWQFERAKSRANSRAGDAFWQFGRAFARENTRMYPSLRKKNFRYTERKGFPSDAYSWI